MKKWTPVYDTFDCPGKIRLIADELGIIIERGKKALATTEWPGENIRVCEATEETAPLTQEIRETILKSILRYKSTAGMNQQLEDVLMWLDSQ